MRHSGVREAGMPVRDSFVERLRAAVAARRPVRIERPEARQAAVAILVTAEADPAILFVERKVREGDPWSGQMALPGGFAAPADTSLSATAERETAEETGITIPGTGALLGILDDVSPRTPYLPPLVVTPCLFVVPERLAATPGPEVESAVWLRVEELYDPGSRRPYRLQFRGVNREFESIVIGRYTIWGLTERVLRQLGDLAGV
jgi:8-oxo-dGTP pyrophosphatase MutT (NUDIX family)